MFMKTYVYAEPSMKSGSEPSRAPNQTNRARRYVMLSGSDGQIGIGHVTLLFRRCCVAIAAFASNSSHVRMIGAAVVVPFCVSRSARALLRARRGAAFSVQASAYFFWRSSSK